MLLRLTGVRKAACCMWGCAATDQSKTPCWKHLQWARTKQTTALHCDLNRRDHNAALTEHITSAYNTDNLFTRWLRVTLCDNQEHPPSPCLPSILHSYQPLTGILYNKNSLKLIIKVHNDSVCALLGSWDSVFVLFLMCLLFTQWSVCKVHPAKSNAELNPPSIQVIMLFIQLYKSFKWCSLWCR